MYAVYYPHKMQNCAKITFQRPQSRVSATFISFPQGEKIILLFFS